MICNWWNYIPEAVILPERIRSDTFVSVIYVFGEK